MRLRLPVCVLRQDHTAFHKTYISLLPAQQHNDSGLMPPMDHVYAVLPPSATMTPYDEMVLRAASYPGANLLFSNDSRLSTGGAICGSFGGAIAGTTHTMAFGPLLSSVFRNRVYKRAGVPYRRERPRRYIVTVLDRVGHSRAFTNVVTYSRLRVCGSGRGSLSCVGVWSRIWCRVCG